MASLRRGGAVLRARAGRRAYGNGREFLEGQELRMPEGFPTKPEDIDRGKYSLSRVIDITPHGRKALPKSAPDDRLVANITNLESNFVTSPHVVLWNQEKQMRVEMVPLYLCCVSKWYVTHVQALITSANHYSTVFLCNPFVGTTASQKTPRPVQWMTRAALDLSMSVDFPATVPVPNPTTAPAYARVMSHSEYLSNYRSGGGAPMDKLCAHLNSDAASRDTVCLLGSPAQLVHAASRLRSADGWQVVSASPMHVNVAAFRRYAFLVCLIQFVVLCAALSWLAMNAGRLYDGAVAWFHRADALRLRSPSPHADQTGAIPLEEVKYFSHGYNPEQEVILERLRDKVLASREGSPPGTGLDTREHTGYFDRKMEVRPWRDGLMGWLPDGAPLEGPEFDAKRLPPQLR